MRKSGWLCKNRSKHRSTWRHSRSSAPHIAILRCPLAADPMRLVRHRMDARRIDPTVKEVEHRAHRDGIVNSLLLPARAAHDLHTTRPDVLLSLFHFAAAA